MTGLARLQHYSYPDEWFPSVSAYVLRIFVLHVRAKASINDQDNRRLGAGATSLPSPHRAHLRPPSLPRPCFLLAVEASKLPLSGTRCDFRAHSHTPVWRLGYRTELGGRGVSRHLHDRVSPIVPNSLHIG